MSEIVSKYGPLPTLSLCPVVLLSYKAVFLYILKNPLWVSGFVCGEGSFTYYKSIKSSSKGLHKTNIQMGFECSQVTSDSYLLQALLYYYGVGILYQHKTVSRIRITQIKHLQHIVIPFFIRYPVCGFKQKQYEI